MSTPLVGASQSFRKTLSVAEQAFFTGISGNLAPLYVDQRAAKAQGFDAMLVFELNPLALATTALNRLAGPAWRLGGVQIDFTSPVQVGDTVEAAATVTAVTPERLQCSVRCTLADGRVVAEGSATLVPAMPSAALPRS